MKIDLITLSFDEAVAAEQELLASNEAPKWVAGQEVPSAGQLVSFLGNVYRATGEFVEDPHLNLNPALSGISYAMHPLSAIKMINQICLMENVQITLQSGQVWVYSRGQPQNYDNHIIMGDGSFYRHTIHDVCGLNIKIAFNGLLKHHKMDLLHEFLSNE